MGEDNVFWVSMQLTLGGWSDEAFYHLGLLKHLHRDHRTGAPMTSLGTAFKSPWRGSAWKGGWELTPERLDGQCRIAEDPGCGAQEPDL